MTIPVLLVSVLLLITQFFENETMSDEAFYGSLSEQLKEICRHAIEEKLETDDLIRLLTPLLDLLTKNASLVRTFRKKFLELLIASFSSVPLTFSLQKIDEGGYVFIVEPKTIRLSIEGSIMYQTKEPTDCRSFCENFVRLYPNVYTPVIQFWILSMGIFEDIFSIFGDVLQIIYLPPKVPQGHPHPFHYNPGYRKYFRFDLFDQIFTILNKSVPGLKITSKDFNEILDILKKVQEENDEGTFEDCYRERWINFIFISALIGFQLRDMLSDEEDKKRITDVLKIKNLEMLRRNVKDEVKTYYLSRISLSFFLVGDKKPQVYYNYLECLITSYDGSSKEFLQAYDALEKFYEELNS